MSEYMEKFAVSRLVGAPPGYVGYEEGGQLTEAVRRRPYQVILLDEIEKAHPDVFNVLLQVLDDGRLTDGQGRTVDFKNTVIIMTSNVGSQLIAAVAGAARRGRRGLRGDEAPGHRRAARLQFRPEFLNRIDEVIVFHALTDADLARDRRPAAGRPRAAARGEQDLDARADAGGPGADRPRGHDPAFGARPLKRTIQRLVENPLARALLAGRVPARATRSSSTRTRRRGTLVFSTERATVVVGGRRPARRPGAARADDAGGAGAGAGPAAAAPRARPARHRRARSATATAASSSTEAVACGAPRRAAAARPTAADAAGGAARAGRAARRPGRADAASSPTGACGRGSRPSPTARPAAVLVLALPGRATATPGSSSPSGVDRDGHHSGEVSFPGGKAEPERRRRRRDRAPRGGRGGRPGPGAAGVRVVGDARRGLDPGQRLPDHAGRRGRGAPPDAAPRSRPRSPGSSSRRVGGVPARRPDRDRRADDPRLAAALRRLPGRRAPRLGRDRPDPRPARRVLGREARPAGRATARIGSARLVARRGSPASGRAAGSAGPAEARPRRRARARRPSARRAAPSMTAAIRDRPAPANSTTIARIWAVLGPRAVGHVGRPQDRLAGRDPGLLLADADPAAALDHDEPGRVRVGVGLDPRRSARRRARAITPAASVWMTWPAMPVVPGGPSGRRWPTPNRRTSIGIGVASAALAGPASAPRGAGRASAPAAAVPSSGSSPRGGRTSARVK